MTWHYQPLPGAAASLLAPASLTSITVSPSTATIIAGETQQFTATGHYSDGSTADLTATVTWSSDDTGTFTVNSSGLVTAVGIGAGITDLLATSGAIQGSAAITVIELSSIAVTPTSASLTLGGTQQFTATATYSDSSTADVTADATWSSSDESVATVDSSGLATGAGGGTATITAELGASSDTASVTVVATVSGTTLAAMQAGSFAHKWVLQIEGCDILLSDASEDAVLAAYIDTPWDPTTYSNVTVLPDLFVELKNSQSIDPWDPFPRGGTLIARVKPNRADTFGVRVARRGHGAESQIGATMDRSTTSIPMAFGLDFNDGPADAFVGTECIRYSGVSSTAMTVAQRGMYSPFKTGTGEIHFSQHHRVGLDPTYVQMNPVISQEPRVWVGKWVSLRMHKFDGVAINTRDDALCVFAGKVVSIVDDPNTLCTVIEVRHVNDVIADTVLFRDQYCAETVEGVYLQSTGILQMVELVNGATNTGNSTAITAGYYSNSEAYQLINSYLGSELAAGRITGTYQWKQEQAADGIRTVVHFNIPNPASSSVPATFEMRMPSELAGFLGMKGGTVVNVGQTKGVGPGAIVFTGANRSFSGTDEPYRTFGFHFGGVDGPSFQIDVVNERGTWIDQRDLLPSGIKYITDGIESSLHGGVAQAWGIVLIDEKVLGFANYDSANHILQDVYIAPWKLTSDPNGSLQTIGRKVSDQSGPVTIRQVLMIESSLANILNYLFYSTGTEGFNHATYDALGYGLGVAIPGELLGTNWENSVAALPHAQAPCVIVIDEPTKIVDLLGSDLLLRRTFPIWRQGGLVMQRWQTPLVGIATYTLNEDNKAEPSGNIANQRSVTMESSEFQRPSVKIDFNRDWSTTRDGQYANSITFEDQVAIDDGGGAADSKSTATIKARNIYSQFTETGQPMQDILADYMVGMPMLSRPQRRLVRSIDLRYYEALAPGDIVIVNDAFARDPLTGLRGVNNRAAIVVRVTYDPGGPTPNGGTRDMMGEVELMFLDTHRGAEYGPAADIDDTASSSGFDHGYNSTSHTLRCKQHQYTESTENADASFFTADDVCFLIERDPADTSSPTFWEVTVSSVSGNDVTLTAGLASPAWDATKKYRLCYANYSDCTVVQQDHAFQADGTDQMIEDVEVADHFSSTHETGSFTVNTGTTKAAFLADMTYGDGKSMDAGFDWELGNLGNVLIDRKTAHQAPSLSTQIGSGSGALDTWTPAAIGIAFLGIEQLSTSVFRTVTVAPWLQLDNTNGATSGQVRVTFSREVPKVSQGITDDGLQPAYFNGNYNQLTWTTSSTTWATGSDQTFFANIKELGTGMVYVVIETYNARCRGLAKLIEGVRLVA